MTPKKRVLITEEHVLARGGVPVFLARCWSRIAIISMNHAVMLRRGFSPNGPSKAALESEILIWAQDLQETGVTVNALLPGGATATGMIPASVSSEVKSRLLAPEIIVRRNLMLYRKMPKTGDILSILGFGCMRLPVENGKIDENRAIRQIRHAVDQGVNYLDTAWPYHGGTSEPLLGKALQDGYRDRVRVATKLPTWLIERREDMDRFLAAQLGKLNTDRIDYYLLHALDGPLWDTLEATGTIDFLNQAKADGRILNAGFSFHGLPEDFSRIVDAYPWEFCQIQYNFLDQENQAGTAGLKYAAANKLGVIVMEPLRGGNLGLASPPPEIQRIWNEARTHYTPAEWALRWVWNHPEVTVVLSGMNDEAHIAENLSIADSAHAGSLTGEELDIVDRVSRKYQELMMVPCTGCGYCMPCPSDVLIPGCFETYNKMHMFGEIETVKFSYALRMSGLLTDGNPTYASQCVQCGECLEKCPQHIAIPDVLEKVAAEMEGPDMEKRLATARELFKKEQKQG